MWHKNDCASIKKKTTEYSGLQTVKQERKENGNMGGTKIFYGGILDYSIPNKENCGKWKTLY